MSIKLSGQLLFGLDGSVGCDCVSMWGVGLRLWDREPSPQQTAVHLSNHPEAGLAWQDRVTWGGPERAALPHPHPLAAWGGGSTILILLFWASVSFLRQPQAREECPETLEFWQIVPRHGGGSASSSSQPATLCGLGCLWGREGSCQGEPVSIQTQA